MSHYGDFDMRPCANCGLDEGQHYAGRCNTHGGGTGYVPSENAPSPLAVEATTEETTAPGILTKAAGLMAERGKQYDQPQGERSMGRAVTALNAVLGREALTESEGWLLLQLLKDVRDRQRSAPHQDSLLDGVAYAALKAESRLKEEPPCTNN